MRMHVVSLVRSSALRSKVFSLEKAYSIEFGSGEDGSLCAGRTGGASNRVGLVTKEIVHDHDIARVQSRYEDLLDTGEEALTVDRIVDWTSIRATGHSRSCATA